MRVVDYSDGSTVQLCIVYQLRNSFRFIPDKYLKDFVKDIRTVYEAPSAEQSWENLLLVQEQWSSRYPQALAGWMANWGFLSAFFVCPSAVRKVIYTTNTVEGYNRELRKVTKTKRAFSSDVALQKLMYLVIKNLETKWETKTNNW